MYIQLYTYVLHESLTCCASAGLHLSFMMLQDLFNQPVDQDLTVTVVIIILIIVIIVILVIIVIIVILIIIMIIIIILTMMDGSSGTAPVVVRVILWCCRWYW